MTDYENEEEYLKFIGVNPGEPGQILKWDGKQYRWVYPDKHLSELESEFGSSSNVRWLTEDQVTAYDGDGNVLLCKCGKKASASIMSASYQVHFCSKCFMGLSDERQKRDS